MSDDDVLAFGLEKSVAAEIDNGCDGMDSGGKAIQARAKQ
jgi:hypothetical protein